MKLHLTENPPQCNFRVCRTLAFPQNRVFLGFDVRLCLKHYWFIAQSELCAELVEKQEPSASASVSLCLCSLSLLLFASASAALSSSLSLEDSVSTFCLCFFVPVRSFLDNAAAGPVRRPSAPCSTRHIFNRFKGLKILKRVYPWKMWGSCWYM